MFLNNPLPTQVVLFAGGPESSSDSIPALVQVNGVPFLKHVLGIIKRNSLTDIHVVTGVGGEAIEEKIGDGRRYGLRIRYFHDPDDRYGTGGSIRALESQLAPSFFTVRADRYFLVDFASAGTAFVQQGLPCLMTVWRNDDTIHPSNCLLGDDDQGRRVVTRYHLEHNSGMVHVACGLNVLRDDMVDLLPDGYSRIEALHQRNALRGRIAAYETNRRYYHVSTSVGLRELRNAFVSGVAPSYVDLL